MCKYDLEKPFSVVNKSENNNNNNNNNNNIFAPNVSKPFRELDLQVFNKIYGRVI